MSRPRAPHPRGCLLALALVAVFWLAIGGAVFLAWMERAA